ncbi:MAG: acyl-ACP thioesterase domain-containing protein [Bacteroidota bacterium]
MKVTEQAFTVRANEVDRYNRASLSGMVSQMQEVAWLSAEELDAGVDRLQSMGISWVLIRFKLEVHRAPKLSEQIKVQSWPSGNEKSFVYRDYRVYDSSRQLIASATSTWLVLDLNSRKMISVPEVFHAITQVPSDVAALPRARERFRRPEGEGHSVEFPVRWHDLDANDHVSNFLFFQWPLEALSLDWLAKRELVSIDLLIRAEGVYGDTIISEAVPQAEDSYYHQIRRKSDGRELARALSRWR